MVGVNCGGCEPQDLLCLECGMDVVFIGRGE